MNKKISTSALLILHSLFGLAQTFTNTTGGGITDDNVYNYYPIAVSGLPTSINNSTFGLDNVTINVTHPNDIDLRIKLQAPDGTIYVLSSFNGGTNANYTSTTFDDTSSVAISAGSAPFTAVFRPTEPMSNFNNGQNPNGTWNLMIRDQTVGNIGSVNSWTIRFSNQPAGLVNFTSSNLPIVVINTGGVSVPDEPKINATMGIIYNGPGMINHLTDPANDYNNKIGIEIRGAYSASLPQKPYAIETRDAANVQTDASLLGMPAEHDWCLIANYNDKAFMRNTLPYQLFDQMGHYSAKTRFCEVVLNGSYEGIYLLTEDIKRDSNRVNIAKLDSTENSGINVTGGYIIKNDYWDGTNSWLLSNHPIDHPTFDVHLVYDYPKPANITAAQKTYIQSFINDFENALYSSNFSDSILGYRQYLSTNSFVDYLLVNELARNNDGFKKSSYFHKDKNSATGISKLKAGPIWDFDWAWKNINECSIFAATDGSGWAYHINDCNPDVNSPGWYVRLMQDTLFQNTVRCRWEHFRETFLSDASLFGYIDSVANYLNAAQGRHFQRWGNLGMATGAPEVDADPVDFAGQITKLKNWIALRTAWLDANLPGTAVNCNFTGVNELQEGMINALVYPNPASNYVTIELANTRDVKRIELLSIDGRAVYSELCNSNLIQLNTSTLANGYYLLKIYTKKENLTIKKIMIIH